MDSFLKQQLHLIANTIRSLSIEAVQKANSGHPGMPMGCAELGAFLYGVLLRHNPKNPKWINRDRLVLSAGHGSMWLYACLHLAGFNLPLEQIKQFRQLHSITPGHPEYGMTPGVEATTGPLGQGVGNAVGVALGLKLAEKKFSHDLFNAKVYCVAGDGCMMEGVSSEVSSLAGHLNLNNLILIYDSNHVCLDGPLPESCSEDTAMRYLAYGWEVHKLDGYDFDGMQKLFEEIQHKQTKPVLVVLNTVIGKGSPNKAGTSKVHGSPLGSEEVEATKKALGLPEQDFAIPDEVSHFFMKKLQQDAANEKTWQEHYRSWESKNPELAKELEQMEKQSLPHDLEKKLTELSIKAPIAGRAASQAVLQELGKLLPQLIGGSADLSVSDLTMMKEYPTLKPNHFEGRNIKYGVREFGMATIANGLFLTGLFTPYCGTFLTFSDYMRNAIRLAALSPYHVIYQFTHDSIFLGEDGPTHQPIEHLAALRAMPNLHLIRPADSHEVRMAWIAALRYRGPTAIILSRQNLPDLEATKISYAEGMARGAYVVKEAQGAAEVLLLSTGSELSIALEAAKKLESAGKHVRVVSFPCWALFDQQPEEYKKKILGGHFKVRAAVEAAAELGWHKYIGSEGITICMQTFGHSAPAEALAKEFGFTPEQIAKRILEKL